MCGSVRFEAVLPTRSYAKINLLFKALGHLTAVYCVTFDRTGEYIMTVCKHDISIPIYINN